MAQNRTFGTQLNGARKPLGTLNIQNQISLKQCSKQANVKQVIPKSIQNQENVLPFKNKKTCKSNVELTSEYHFEVFNDNSANKKRDDNDMLEENIEAVKKELDSFLIDSIEKWESDVSEKENKCADESLMAVDNEDDSLENYHDDSLTEISEVSFVNNYSEFERLYDYSDSILDYMLETERKFMPDPFYMNNQTNINTKMRSILVDWLVDVSDEYKLKDETLFLTINYIDRFLSKVSITRQEFQLLGTAALFIASKYEEVYPPLIGEFVYITDDSFNKYQILKMEKLILSVLNFDISTPTVSYFLETYFSDLSLGREVYCLSKYLSLLTLLECTPFLKYYPSEIALASIFLAAKTLGVFDQISKDFIKNSLRFECSLKNNGDILQFLNERNTLMEELSKLQMFAVEHPQQAIQRKFSTSKYYNVSKLTKFEQMPNI